MPIIDFRARPNTAEYMNAFRLESPEAVTLDEFVGRMADFDISMAVYTNRQSYAGSLDNGVVAKHIADHPERLIGFGSVDARLGDEAAREIERCVKSLALRGIGLDPPDDPSEPAARGYDDPAVLPLYDIISDLGVPVVLTLGPNTVRYGGPASVDRIATQFPSLTIVCSHAVWPEIHDWVAVALRHKNVILEPSLYWHYPGTEAFFEAAERVIPEQVVYASGFPFNPLNSIVGFSGRLRSRESVERITWSNAARILDL